MGFVGNTQRFNKAIGADLVKRRKQLRIESHTMSRMLGCTWNELHRVESGDEFIGAQELQRQYNHNLKVLERQQQNVTTILEKANVCTYV